MNATTAVINDQPQHSDTPSNHDYQTHPPRTSPSPLSPSESTLYAMLLEVENVYVEQKQHLERLTVQQWTRFYINEKLLENSMLSMDMISLAEGGHYE